MPNGGQFECFITVPTNITTSHLLNIVLDVNSQRLCNMLLIIPFGRTFAN